MTNTLGGPEKISNSLRLLQTSLTDAVFDAEAENDLHFEAGGRTPEHKRNFQIEVLMKRCYIFRAVRIINFNIILTMPLFLVLNFGNLMFWQ